MNEMLKAAQAAKMEIAQLSTEDKNKALLAMAQALLDHSDTILAANAMDMDAARGTVSDVMLDRLQLTAGNITRGQAAVVLYNTLLAASKTTGKEYCRSANGTVSCQKAIVLDVSAKNGGASDQLMVCANGAIGYYDQKMKVPADFVGAVGQVLLSSENKGVGWT